MTVIFVLSISVLLQFLAAIGALMLMRYVGGRLAWLALATAILLMGIRRTISLSSAIINYPDRLPMLNTELVALMISALMVVAVFSIRPLFESIRRSEQALAQETRRNQTILDSSPDGFVITDLKGNLREANRAYCEMVGYRADELIGMHMSMLSREDNPREVEERFQALTDVGQAWYETQHRHKDGHTVELDVTAKYVESGAERFIYIFYRDITARKETEAALFGEKERALVTLESIGDGVVTTDTEGLVQYMNPVAEFLTGADEEKARGKSLTEVLRFRDEHTGEWLKVPISTCLEKNTSVRLGGHTLVSTVSDREDSSVEVSISPIHNDKGDVVGTVLVLHDVTELRGLARQLTYQATHDSLTGLINRREFEVRLEFAIENSKRNGISYAVCYLDLDQFKVVNDTCGHVAGDELLRQLSRELGGSIRETDTLARLGGDEFGVLLADCELEQAETVSAKLLCVVQNFRFVWQHNIFEIGVSIGLVPVNENSATLTDVLSAADSACYVAKEQGRNRIHVFQEDDKALATRHGQMQWMQRIQRALDEDRFRIFSQLIKPVSNKAGEHWHAELLLRMVDEEGNLVLPGNFLPAAERYHLMPAIDRWVIRNAFDALKSESELGKGQVELYTINLSGQSLGDESFLEDVLEILGATQMQAERICFEITETAVIANLANAQHFIEVMRNKGCRFSLDDFGSGLSSFSYLKVLPVDFLKIDGSFVQGILKDKNDLTMVKSINQIGHVMGMLTIAEFVEDKATLAELVALGVDFVQGFEIARPQPLLADLTDSESSSMVGGN